MTAMRTPHRTLRLSCGFLLLLVAAVGAAKPSAESLTVLNPAAANNRGDVTVFVGPQTRDGFVDVDKGVLQAIKGLISQLRGRKGLRVVPTKEEAQVVLEVLSLGATSTSGGGAVGIPV